MHTLDIPEKDVHIEYPSCWEEMTTEQFDFVMQQIIKLEDRKLSIEEFKLLILYNFLGIKLSPFALRKSDRMTEEELEEKYQNTWQLTETLNYFFILDEKEGAFFYRLNYDSVKNFLPVLHINGNMFYGPAHGLTDCSFAEYRHAFDAYRNFSVKHEPNELNKLVAILYRPEREHYQDVKLSVDYDGQQREKYNYHLVADRAGIINELPYYQKYAIYLFFRNCDLFFRTKEIEVSGQQVCFKVLFKEGEEKGESLGLNSLLFSMADAGTFGNIKETDEANLYDIFLKLYDAKLKYEEFKRKNKIKDD